MASFAQDVTTPVKIPDVAPPNFNQNTSGVQDFATALNIGLQFKNNQDAKAREADRVKKLNQLDTVVSSTLKSIASKSGQNGGISNVQMQKLIDSKASSLNGSDYRYVIDGISTGLSSSAFSPVQKELSEEETTVGIINGRSVEAQDFAYNIVGVVNSSEASKEQLNKVDQLSRRFDNEQAKIKDSQDELVDSPSVAKLAVYLNNLNDGSTSLIISTLNKSIQGLTENGAKLGQENLKQLQTAQSGFADAQQQKTDMAIRQFNLSVVGMSKDEGARAKILVDNFVASSKRFSENVKGMTEEQFSSFTQLAKNLQDKGVISLHKIMPRVAALGEAGLGNNLSSLFKKMVKLSGKGKLIGKEMADFLNSPDGLLSQGFDVNVGSAAQVANSGVNVDNILDLYQGKAIADARVEDRVGAAKDVWNHISSVLETPNGVKDMSEKESDVFGLGVVEILDMAQRDGTPEDMARANELLTSKGFMSYMVKFKKTHPQEAITLSSYVASSTAMMLEREFNSDKKLSYDIDTGKVGIEKVERQSRIGDRLGLAEQVASTADRVNARKAKQIQDRINSAAQILSENSPALNGDVNAAKEYIASFINREQVKGSPTPRDTNVDSAVKQGVTVEDIQKRIDKQAAFDRASSAVRDTGKNLSEARVGTTSDKKPAPSDKKPAPTDKTITPAENKQIDKQIEEQKSKVKQLSTLTPEELKQFKTIDLKTIKLLNSLSPEGKARFEKMSIKDQVFVLSLTPEQLQTITMGLAPTGG